MKTRLPWLVAVAFFMEFLDTTFLNTAVRVMATALKGAPLSMKSVLSSYTLSVAVSSPVVQFMVPESKRASRPVLLSGLHSAFFLLGGLTVLSAFIFWELREDDGNSVSQHHAALGAE